MIGVKYLGPYQDSSGYGEATRNAIMALTTAGADICTEKIVFTKHHSDNPSVRTIQELSERKPDYKINILHVTPDLYKNYIEKGKYNIGHLFWETDRLPNAWVPSCNLLNEVWTGSELNAKAIRSSGVTVPIYIYPQSINTDIPEVRPYKIKDFDGLLFYSIFEWKERKNPRALLESFWKEFKGLTDVALLIKAHIGDYEKEGVEKILHEARLWKNTLGFKDTPKVFICTNHLTYEEKHRLHKTGVCFVSSHRGEGWGLPQVEAALHTKSIISTKYGGVHEHWTAKQYKPVEFDLVPIKQIYNKYYEPGMQWAEINQEDLRKKMRRIYDVWSNPKSRGILKITANAARNYVKTFFSYQVVGKAMLERLQEIEKSL